MEIITHFFNTTVEAYEAAQTDEGINDGDVLVIQSEEVVAIVGDFPIAVTSWAGELHALEDGDTLESLGFDPESIAKAEAEAEHIGAALIARREVSEVSKETIDRDVEEAFDCLDNVLKARAEAKVKAWDALGRYKFEMFGYWASSWVKYNQALPRGLRVGNPFKRAVELARESRNELATRSGQ